VSARQGRRARTGCVYPLLALQLLAQLTLPLNLAAVAHVLVLRDLRRVRVAPRAQLRDGGVTIKAAAAARDALTLPAGVLNTATSYEPCCSAAVAPAASRLRRPARALELIFRRAMLFGGPVGCGRTWRRNCAKVLVALLRQRDEHGASRVRAQAVQRGEVAHGQLARSSGGLGGSIDPSPVRAR
jgi:hypothetical protein